MTVQELINLLKGEDPDSPVRLAMLPENHSYKIDGVEVGGHRQLNADVTYILLGEQEAYDVEGLEDEPRIF